MSDSLTDCIVHHEPRIDHDNSSITENGRQLDYPVKWKTTRYMKQQHLATNPSFMFGLFRHIQCRKLIRSPVVIHTGSVVAQEYPPKSSGKQSGMPSLVPAPPSSPPTSSYRQHKHVRSVLNLWSSRSHHRPAISCRRSQASEVGAGFVISSSRDRSVHS